MIAIRTQLLSDESIERFKSKLIRRLRRPAADGARVRKLEAELSNITGVLAQGIRSAALLERLQTTEAELERLRAAAKVVDLKAILAVLPAAVARYREMVENLGESPIDIEQAREVIREITDRIPVRQGEDGVPVAELSLNESMPLGQAAVGSIQIGMVAGA
jgi:chromatin segregation and condensation protein Rec8/ScpA/Scc1 (kleisin family)